MIFKENSRRKWLAIIYVVAFFLLEILIVTNSSFIYGIDHATQNIFSAITSPFNTKIFSFITFLGSPLMDVIYLIIMMLLLYRMGRKDASFWIGFVLIGGNIISYLIKITVKRTRPTDKIIPASGFSFPSGHVFGTMLVIMTLIFLVLPMIKSLSNRHTINILLIIWLIVVAISRVYLRGHFLSDVTGSMLLAGAWWECSEMLYLKYYDSIGNFLRLNKSDQ
ncbi:phosphatase PAP2 family protein [Companilactobacillus huachuanensis]|uniref:Phosphatase PAP2 family protein n=1 Tax=Companilactobacillus huachuanensis TaxID=2559914 RepID=A0ABW1RHR2_9LACO|nr:phosphatase PAP2 family protein [Companilactobacillus huachuanensis]